MIVAAISLFLIKKKESIAVSGEIGCQLPTPVNVVCIKDILIWDQCSVHLRLAKNKWRWPLPKPSRSFPLIPLSSSGDGDEVQQSLLEWNGQRTVPNVFIGREHVGGCDSLLAKHQQGKILPMLKDAAAVPNNPAKV
ncbi:hypothetical protein K7X08_024579 [Anisodus acutangulus]|uniref:Glutaredoxin domain-containing protein n=1 Tax=Anisodus acutangulus TaxID=402998 RepID=A0A9Q1MBE1_9SOLA|nr:hypothetical protein K7X08_024579 [Anisodus acutangulus]